MTHIDAHHYGISGVKIILKVSRDWRKARESHIKNNNQNAFGLPLQHQNAENNSYDFQTFKPRILYPAKLLMKY